MRKGFSVLMNHKSQIPVLKLSTNEENDFQF